MTFDEAEELGRIAMTLDPLAAAELTGTLSTRFPWLKWEIVDGDYCRVTKNEDLLTFKPVDEFFTTKPRRCVFTGPSPWHLYDRANIEKLKGRRVRIKDHTYEILAFETFATVQGPRVGVSIGIMVGDETS